MRASWQAMAAIALAGSGGACGGETGVEVPVVATVVVTSPLGALWDVGAAVQLTATAQDAQGNTASGVTFNWTSSNSQVASVGAAGLVQASAVGSATIQAKASEVSGSFPAQVVDADLAGITGVAGDAFVTALVSGTTSAVRARLQTAVSSCATNAGQGNLEAIQQCIAAIRAEAAGATDPTDRALLAVLGLFADQLERLLNA